MIYMIDQIYRIVMVIIFMLMTMMLIFFALYMSATRKKKQRREMDMYFQSLDRKDAKDFLDFEDIVDEMIVTNHHRTFIAAFKCRGFNIGTSSSAQVASALQGYLGFVNTIKSPITFRQYFVPMNLDNTKSMYSQRYKEVEQSLFHMTGDWEDNLQRLNEIRGLDVIQEEVLQQEMLKLQKEISILEWRRDHLKDQMQYMDRMFEGKALYPSVEEAYLVEWSYNSNDYSIELSEEEIHKKAIQELDNICNNMIATLGRCNVSAYRCTTDELIEMFYQHTHPLSSAEFKMSDIQNSEYFDEFVTSHDLERREADAYTDAMIEDGADLAEAAAEAIVEEMERLEAEKQEGAEDESGEDRTED